MRFLSSGVGRLVSALILGLLAGGIALIFTPIALAGMIAITVTAGFFMLAGLLVLWPMSTQETAQTARRQDLNPLIDELVVAVAALGGLAGIIGLLVLGGSHTDALPAAVALVGVFMAWGGLHVMYATRYAYIYYDVDHPGGIDFNTQEEPCFRDFFYVSFAVGMTYGVTDSGVATTRLRVVVLRHAVMSFIFGAVILATAINLVTSTFTG